MVQWPAKFTACVGPVWVLNVNVFEQGSAILQENKSTAYKNRVWVKKGFKNDSYCVSPAVC